MKKQISYLLTLVLVLSLCGVMGPVNKTVKAAEYGSTVDITNDFSQTFTMDANTNILTIPITVQKAGWLTFSLECQGFADKVAVDLRTTKEYSSNVEDHLHIIQRVPTAPITFQQAASGPVNWYLMVLKNDLDVGKEVSFTLKTNRMDPTQDTEAKSGQTMNIVQVVEKGYYKFTLDAPSKVTFQSEFDFTLCNAAKKEIGNTKKVMYLSNGTYYFCNTSAGKFSFTYTAAKIKASSNTSKKKAQKLSLKKKAKGFFTMENSKQAYWYKLNLKKTKKLVFSSKLSSKADSLYYEIYNKKGKSVAMGFVKGTGTKKVYPFPDKKKKNAEKIPKGTYYVKVDGLNNLPFEFMMK